MIYRLPPPISLNGMHVPVNGRKIKSAKYRRWTEEADWMLSTQDCTPLGDGPFRIRYMVPKIHFETGRRVGSNTDLDNRIKCLADAIVRAGIIPDDSMKYTVGFTAGWVEDIEHSLITITEVDE